MLSTLASSPRQIFRSQRSAMEAGRVYTEKNACDSQQSLSGYGRFHMRKSGQIFNNKREGGRRFLLTMEHGGCPSGDSID